MRRPAPPTTGQEPAVTLLAPARHGLARPPGPAREHHRRTAGGGPRRWSLVEVEAAARLAHAGHTDRTGRPYLEHIVAVAEGVRARGGSAEQLAAGWLHDTVEHHRVPLRWLHAAPLPRSVKDMVIALTRGDEEDLESYVGRIRATPGAPLVKAADLASNTDPARLAALDAPTRERLTEKYARTWALLGPLPR
ncbi:HD domain-containing protein [Streptomyces sp. NPDC000594]|uniref:HD domain-containing protein n=1 Tax=Streptomyces sp. NPDC000594 TaxID=3154261 RepID=UPI00332D1FEC